MELKVWVEGIQRIVCGVSDSTTCQDVVFALAHATGKIGRFTLIERWRNNERHLAPNDNPLKILMKWGEYSNDVQFILQKSDPPKNASTDSPAQQLQQQQVQAKKTIDTNNLDSFAVDKDPKKAFNLVGDNVGIVRGVQQTSGPNIPPTAASPPIVPKPATYVLPHLRSPIHSSQSSNDSNNFIQQQQTSPKKNFNSKDVRNNLDRLSSCSSSPEEPVIVVSNGIRPNSPPISNNGALVPPPYRDPPPPVTLPSTGQPMVIAESTPAPPPPPPTSNGSDSPMDTTTFLSNLNNTSNNNINSNQYRDLLQLIKFQREKLTAQQLDMTRFDEEIELYERREREQSVQLEAITREIQQQDQLLRQGSDQLQTLQYVEEENELVRQQEKTLKSEITLLRSKLANCETELLQCRNKVKYLMDEIQLEQRAAAASSSSRFDAQATQRLERQLAGEIERLQGDIDQMVSVSENTVQATDRMKHEVSFLEAAIVDKKKQVEQLVHEMKEVNLQSLAVAPPSEEIRHLLEGGAIRPGSTRRIIGSPRQLENAVPTSKNPHGVWV